MKLNPKEFKRFKELAQLVKSHKASAAEEAEYNALAAKKNELGSNDPKWWLNYPDLAKAVTNFPFNYIPGTAFGLSKNGGSDKGSLFTNLVKFGVIETVGKSSASTDPINTQIRQLWLDLHRKYRGIGTYEQADLGIALLAIRSCFNMIAKFERLYGVVNTYHVGNRAIPYALKEALGIGQDIEDNLANFRYILNFNIEKLRQLCLPKGLSALEADIVVLSNVFKDSENRRASLFVFDTETYGKYDATSLSTGGSVMYYPFHLKMTGVTPAGESAFTVADIKGILDECVNALLEDEDIARICSDLLAAYGPENVMTLLTLPEDYKVEPVHDGERLLQMHNATACGNVAFGIDTGIKTALDAFALYNSNVRNVIYQKDNVIHNELASTVNRGVQQYGVIGDYAYPQTTSTILDKQMRSGSVLFDTWSDTPSEGDILVGTRFTTLAGLPTAQGTTPKCQVLSAWGTMIVTRIVPFYYRPEDKNFTYSEEIEYSYAQSIQVSWAELSQVDWAPMMYLEHQDGAVRVFGDVDNFTEVTSENLVKVHEVAILSGFKFNQVTSM